MEQQQLHQQQLRNLRDFLLVYNRMTELCFQRCVPSLHHRALDAEEVGPSPSEACLHNCAGKLIHSNHRLMAAYVQLMPALVQRRIADYEAASAVPGVATQQPPVSPSGS
ncbi:mitochondrial import inner membrane translocase subunit Tim10 B isoform X2 [Ochotona curzoniae]|uniref:mitochondrial import inner membrane translocase subunit Tim10 B isoform X2 n=1 Tax=Ochotona curzoniae TaxID=130825 RepID=UPI001B34F150|nr:mitochondrial import inner membrane translocase subunit Tim10 B isoform X2 [Ochotona curzoniae]